MNDTACKIRFGNHWLLCDEHRTQIEWISDRAVANWFTQEWAKKFQDDMLFNNKHVQLFTAQELKDYTERERKQKLRTYWLNRFDTRAREVYGLITNTEGLWTSGHMYYSQGLTVDEAVAKCDHLKGA